MRRGETVTIEDCVRQHPAYARQLRELFPALQLLRDLWPPASDWFSTTGCAGWENTLDSVDPPDESSSRQPTSESSATRPWPAADRDRTNNLG
jgi:hypothetical protein